MSFTSTRLSDREIALYEGSPPIFRVRTSRTTIDVVVPRYVFTEFGDRYREAGGVYSPRTSTYTFPIDAEDIIESINTDIVRSYRKTRIQDAELSPVDLFPPIEAHTPQTPREGLMVRDVEYVEDLPSEELVTALPALPSLLQEVEESSIYSPQMKDSSESQWEYTRRVALYRGLLEMGLSDGAADLLSRMRNQVDLYGVSYSQNVMEILNTYLPLD